MTPDLMSPWWRWYPVWLRNLKVWRKLLGPALLGNIGEPVLYLLALGYGLGSFLSTLDGLPYVVYLASGMACASAMNTASFEGMYSAYTRMAVQDTWLGMLTAPLDIRDVLIAEVIWAGTKSLISVVAILLVAGVLGLVTDLRALLVLPLAWLLGCCFGAMALTITAVARNYDSFLYYFTLLITPMLLLSGVFFPVSSMPAMVQTGAGFLPLYHAVALMRPLMTGAWPAHAWLHLSVLLLYTLLAFPLALRLIRRRLIK
ncbi:MAG: nodulation protein NodJ [Gammaproteobacteria bacterium]|nr:nodulation protein NodJ [Gammaproteobacteria bacterium]